MDVTAFAAESINILLTLPFPIPRAPSTENIPASGLEVHRWGLFGASWSRRVWRWGKSGYPMSDLQAPTRG